MYVRDLVTEPHCLALQGFRVPGRSVVQHPVKHFAAQIQALPLLFKHPRHTHALLKMQESERTHLIQRTLSRMSEGRVPKIMPEGNRFHQVLVQAQAAGHGSCRLGHFQRVHHPRPVMVAPWGQENLGLILQPSERFAVDNPVPVTHIACADIAFIFRNLTSGRIRGTGSVRAQAAPLILLQLFPDQHGITSPFRPLYEAL